MPTVAAGDVDLYVTDEGQGDSVVMIHGHTLDHRMWDQQVPALTAAGYRVIRPDLRGHGRSAAPATGYSPNALAADIKAALDSLGVERAHIVGLSRGGGVALAFVLDEPTVARSVTFVDSVLPGRAFTEEFGQSFPRLNRTFAEAGRETWEEAWWSSPLFDGVRRFPDAARSVREMIRGYSAAEMRAAPAPPASGSRPRPLADRLGEVGIPALAIVGELDERSFHLFAEELARGIPGGRLLVIPDAGHMANMERPDAVNAGLLEFFGSVA